MFKLNIYAEESSHPEFWDFLRLKDLKEGVLKDFFVDSEAKREFFIRRKFYLEILDKIKEVDVEYKSGIGDPEFWLWFRERKEDGREILDKYFNNDKTKEWVVYVLENFKKDAELIKKIKGEFDKQYGDFVHGLEYSKEKNNEILKKEFTELLIDKKFGIFLKKIDIFWGGENGVKSLNVFLFSKYGDIPNGITGRALSGVEKKVVEFRYSRDLSEIVGKGTERTVSAIFVHEISHQIQHLDGGNLKRLVKGFLSSKQDFLYSDFLESINSSISHYNFGLFLEECCGVVKIRADGDFKNKLKKGFFEEGDSAGIKQLKVAYRILPETRRYFEEGKKIDEAYVKKVFDIWEELSIEV